jgi:hypothetical protein
MKYMLLVYFDEHSLSESERAKCYRDSAQLVKHLNATGVYVDAFPLHLTPTATSVRVRGGKRVITDCLSAETHDKLSGYFLIDAKNLHEAISIAERLPVARVGTIEIRSVMKITDLPEHNPPNQSPITNN